MPINRGAQVIAADMKKRTALVRAAKHGHDKIVRLLIDNGA